MRPLLLLVSGLDSDISWLDKSENINFYSWQSGLVELRRLTTWGKKLLCNLVTVQQYAIFYPQLLPESTKVTCQIFNWSNITMTFPLCRLQALHLSRCDVIPPEPTADVAAMVTTRQSQKSAEVDCGCWSRWPNSWLDLLAVLWE